MHKNNGCAKPKPNIAHNLFHFFFKLLNVYSSNLIFPDKKIKNCNLKRAFVRLSFICVKKDAGKTCLETLQTEYSAICFMKFQLEILAENR